MLLPIRNECDISKIQIFVISSKFVKFHKHFKSVLLECILLHDIHLDKIHVLELVIIIDRMG